MNTQNNAAQVAVMAEPCPKNAGAVILPTMQQTMLTALAFVQHSLEYLVRVRCDDMGWEDQDADIHYAVDLALEHIKGLRAELPADRDVFDRKWLMAAAAINLSVRSFSHPDSSYFRLLTFAQQQFEVLVAIVEFVDGEARHGV